MQILSRTTFALSALILALPALVSAHGYLSSPPPRGAEKESTDVDSLKSPDHNGMCRGEPEGQLTNVAPGGPLTLQFTITAPHVGPCAVYLMNPDFSGMQQIASKNNCAAPGQVAPWTVQIPASAHGHMVLRWTWEGQHVTPSEHYEQCVDLMVGGGSGGASYSGGAPMPPSAPDMGSADGTDASDASDDSAAPAQTQSHGSGAPMPIPAAGHGSVQGPMPSGQAQSYGASSAPASAGYNGNSDSGPSQNSYGASSGPPAPPSNVNYGSNAPAQAMYGQSGASTGSQCTSGQYVCQGPGFAVCSNGSWIQQGCGTGTVCQSTGGSISCVMAASATAGGF